MVKRWLTRDINLFSGARQAENFRNFAGIYPVRVTLRSEAQQVWPAGSPFELPSEYEFDGSNRSTETFLKETETNGLLVLIDGRISFEAYAGPLTADVAWPCWSVTKSFVSTLIGIAIDRSEIPGVDSMVTELAPQLAGSAYDGVRLKDVLTMSSGARWYENYADPNSDTRRHGVVHATGGSLDAFAQSLPREWEPGTRLRYNSIDTNVLGLVLRRATRKSLSTLLHERLWEPLGAEHEAYFVVDGEGAEWAGAGLICTLRDRARLGALIANGGAWGDVQLVSESWTAAATTPSAQHLTCEQSAAKPFGYGYQWWLFGSAVSAIGIYNQYLWIDPARRVVIAKASSNRHYGRSFDEAGYRDLEHMALFQAIASKALRSI